MSEQPLAQLREVITVLSLELDERRLLTRCLPCNAPTHEIDPSEAGGRVPPYVLRTQSRFRRCASCGRVYWGATHRAGILERVRRVFSREPLS